MVAFALVFCGIAGIVFGRVARSVGRSVAAHQALLDDEVRQRTRELKVSESRLREAQRVAGFGAWDWDIVANELYWSEEIYRLFGVSPNDFDASYEAFMRFVHPDDRESVEEAMQGAIRFREPYGIEHRIVRADGETRFVLVCARASFAEDGRAVRMLGIVQDITERRRAADLKQRFGRILEASLNEIYVFDAETYRFVQVNEGARRNLGYTMPELRELTPWDIKPQVCEDRFRDMVEPLRRGRTETLRFETEHLRRDGSVYPVEVRLQLFCEEEPPVFVAIINDITERRKAEQDIKALNKSLEQRVEERTAELRNAQKQLVEAEKMASLGDLVAGVAHEINTPIGIGVTAASHLGEMTSRIQATFENGGIRKSEFETYLQGCSESGTILLANLRRASDLIRSFKQIAVDQSVEERRVIDLKAYLNDIILNLSPKTKCCDVKIQVRCAAEIELYQNPGAIAQIITNLVMNSLTHAFDAAHGGVIRIEAEAADGVVELSYGDDGKGIPEGNLSRIFEPFFTTQRGQGGSGLGLNVVYNLVTRELGGSISCASRPGDGTTFHLRFPARRGSDA